jgi:hypothetical protein
MAIGPSTAGYCPSRAWRASAVSFGAVSERPRRAIELIEHPETAPRTSVLPVELVVRASTAS